MPAKNPVSGMFKSNAKDHCFSVFSVVRPVLSGPILNYTRYLLFACTDLQNQGSKWHPALGCY